MAFANLNARFQPTGSVQGGLFQENVPLIGNNENSSGNVSNPSLNVHLRNQAVLDNFRRAWQAEPQPDWRFYLSQVSEEHRSGFVAELVKIDVEFRRAKGQKPQFDDYANLPGELQQAVVSVFQGLANSNPQMNQDQKVETVQRCDKNLLFGILALQLGFIGKDALLSALKDWMTQKHTPLARILVERGDLSHSRQKLLEPVVEEHILRHNRDASASLASLSSVSDAEIDWQQVQDPEIEQSIARRRSTRNSATRQPEINTTADGNDRFRLLRLHAEGGLGAVYVANDSELNREVALKKIKPQFVRDESSRSRFVLEAEITGGLEHPGIVPIYGLGRYPDGQPFYAMRFIRGDSLKDAIQAFHFEPPQTSVVKAQAEPSGGLSDLGVANDVNAATVLGSEGTPDDSLQSTPQAAKRQQDVPRTQTELPTVRRLVDYSSMEFRRLLGRFIDVCEAMEYAHSRGVLHRDLKPGNIMLGKYGETLVVDWGLAKAGGRNDRFPASDEVTLQPQSGSSIDKTVDGTVIGTPAYMSPEQAAGRLEELGPATDVYGLGATLYHMLTGQSPIHGNNLAESLKRIQTGDIPAPHSIISAIPKALDAVCRKAMTVDSRKRYARPSDLAAELERFLADEPVTALRESVSIRVRRWSRKHQTLVSTFVAVSTLAAIGLTLVTSLISGKNGELALANTEIQQQSAVIAAKNRTLEEANSELTVSKAYADAQRLEAETNLKLANHRLYNGDMNLIKLNWDSSRVSSIPALLGRYRNTDQNPLSAGRGPTDPREIPEDNDLRSFSWFYWDRLRQSEFLTLRGYSDFVMGVSLSPDGKQLALAGLYGEIKLFDSTNGKEVLSMNAMDGLLDIAYSPDGQRIAAGGSAGEVSVWNATTGEVLSTLKGHTERVVSVIFSLDGRLLASGSFNGEVKLWDLATGREASALKSHRSRVMSMRFSPDGQSLLSASQSEVTVWDELMGNRSLSLKGHSDNVACETFSADGSWLAAGSFEGAITVWNATSGDEVMSFKGHKGTVSSVAFSRDGLRLASAGKDGTVKVWDVTARELDFSLNVHDGGVSDVVFSPDGLRLVSVGGSAYDRKGNPSPGEVKLWDATTAPEYTDLHGSTARLWSATMRRDELCVAYSAEDGTTRVRNAATGKELLALSGSTEKVYSLAYSDNGLYLASASLDHIVQLWDARTGDELFSLTGHKGAVSGLMFSPDSHQLLSASWDGTTKIWDTSTGQEIHTLDGERGNVTAIALSPDGRNIASGFLLDGTVQIWDAANGYKTLSLAGHTSGVTCLRFSADGNHLVSGSNDGTLKVWDVMTGVELFTLMGHTDEVTCVAVSSSGKEISSGSKDGSIKVWDAKTGQECLSLRWPPGNRKLNGLPIAVGNLCFSSDGMQLVASTDVGAGGTGYLIVFDARPWTQELRNEQRGRAVCRHLLGHQRLPRDEALQWITQDQSLSQDERAKACEFVETWHIEP